MPMKQRSPEIEQLKRQLARAQHAHVLAANDFARFERFLAAGRFPAITAEREAQLRAVYAQAIARAARCVDDAAAALTAARGHRRVKARRVA